MTQAPVIKSIRWRLIILMLMAIWAISLSVQAQDPTATAPVPTPTPDSNSPEMIRAWEHVLVFPVELRLTVLVDLPRDDIDTVQVIIEPEQGTPQQLTLDPVRDFRRNEGFTRLDHVWTVPAANPPALLTEIRYTWQINPLEGEQITLTDVVFYANPQIEWERATDPEDRFSFILPKDSLNPTALRNRLNEAYDVLLSQGEGLPTFNYAIGTPDALVDPCLPGEEGGSYVLDPATDEPIDCENRVQTSLAAEDFRILTVPVMDAFGILNEIVPQMVNTFYAPIWSEVDLPEWYVAAMSRFYLPLDNFGMVRLSRRMVRENRYFQYEDIEPAPQDPARLIEWEAQTYTMILYLAQEVGVQGVFQLARTVGENGESFGQSYERVIGAPVSALVPGWQHWIFSDQAEAASALDLYFGPTLMPDPTHTPTAYPPTDGPTPTASATATERTLPTRTPTPTPGA